MVSPLPPYISFGMHHQQLSTDRISFAEFPEEPRVTCLQSYKSILDRSQSTDPSPMQDLHQISITSKAKGWDEGGVSYLQHNSLYHG